MDDISRSDDPKVRDLYGPYGRFVPNEIHKTISVKQM